MYAKPSLCYSAFPLCREITTQTADISSDSFNALNSSPQNDQLEPKVDDIDELSHSYNLPFGHSRRISRESNWPESEKNEQILNRRVIQSTKKKLLNQKLRRICRDECELLENELCRKEYAIAKRHPLLGQQVPLVECADLPLPESKESSDCLSLGISVGNNAQEDDYCYYSNGESYRGITKVSASGRPCLRWSNQFNLQISNYVESLAGGHSYCRNPGGHELQPWCYVDASNKMTKESCNIPKCTIERYIIIWINGSKSLIALLLVIIVISLFYIICYR